MGWTISYELRRDRPLTADERRTIEQHVARHDKEPWDVEPYALELAPGPNVLASGFTKIPFEPEHRDVRRLLKAITELRSLLPDTECVVADDFEVVYWDDGREAYSMGVDDDDDIPLPPPDVPRPLPVEGVLQLERDADESIVSTRLAATLRARDLQLAITLERSFEELDVRKVTVIGRAHDKAPCFVTKILNNDQRDRLREAVSVPERCGDMLAAIELFAGIRYTVGGVIASFDARASRASRGELVTVDLTPRASLPAHGLELLSIAAWTTATYEDQQVVKFIARVRGRGDIRHDAALVFQLFDADGTSLGETKGRIELPIEYLRAHVSPVDATIVDRLHRIDVRMRGTLEDQVRLGTFRVAR